METKKQWISPEVIQIDVNNGGADTGDGPSDGFSGPV